MTHPGDQLRHRSAYVGHQAAPRRNKLAPDPDVRRAILAAASKSVQEQGVRGLSVAAVLGHARLSTRAFYRHFESKDQLVTAVFAEMTRDEVLRLRTKMAAAANPVEAVVAWIDGRLDLALDENLKWELRDTSLESQSHIFSSPDLIPPAYAAILEPLVEQLELGLGTGEFQDIVPATAAKSIHGVVWAAMQRQCAAGTMERGEVRDRAVRFCLRGLGVASATIERIASRR